MTPRLALSLLSACLLPELSELRAQAADPAGESPETTKTYWQDLTDGTIDLYENDDSPWLRRMRLTGRAHYQAARVEGSDARGRDFTREFDEYRRLRLGAEIEFNDFLSAEIDTHLVEDNRFRGTSNHTGFGYQELADAWLAIDLEDAFDWEWVDDLDLKLGRQKIGVGYERHQSSTEILTIERSALADKLGGDSDRPTGVLFTAEKGEAQVSLGVFSTSPATGLARFEGDGFLYASFEVDLGKRWELVADAIRATNDGPGDSRLGYAWAGSLSLTYERGRGGVMLNLVHGNNGDATDGNPRARRQGEFSGFVVMPWFWLKADVLQFVVQAQFQRASASEGLRIGSRYLRTIDDVPGFDVENGYGDRHQSLYLGLNWHPWGGRTRLMGGFLAESLQTVRQPVEATSQYIAVRTEF